MGLKDSPIFLTFWEVPLTLYLAKDQRHVGLPGKKEFRLWLGTWDPSYGRMCALRRPLEVGPGARRSGFGEAPPSGPARSPAPTFFLACR